MKKRKPRPMKIYLHGRLQEINPKSVPLKELIYFRNWLNRFIDWKKSNDHDR